MMRHAKVALAISSLSLLLAVSFAGGETVPADKGGQGSLKTKEKRPGDADLSPEEIKELKKKDVKRPPAPTITYTPPLRGAPRGRIGGGSRGIGDDLYTLLVLAPDHVGLTAREQPVLYWYLSRGSSYPMELTLIEQESIKPLLEEQLEPPVAPGFHAFDLSEHGIRLERDLQYQWFVSIVPDPDRRSRDILAGGVIERIQIPQGEKEEYERLTAGDRAIRYAAAGFWYDAVQSVMEMMGSDAYREEARKMRRALMRQVGLGDVGAQATQ